MPNTTLAPSLPSPPPRRLPPVPSHWILHPTLLGIPIRVTITAGKWKRKTAFVTPMSSEHEGGRTSNRLRMDQKYSERPKPNSEQSLMVVTGGDEQHRGKFARRIFYFYNQIKSDDARWFIVGVVDRTGRYDRLTDELLELSPADLEIVEESKEDRDAGNGLFEDVRYTAKVGKPEIRRPGEGDLGNLRNACMSALLL
ncbi:hypothetical protein AAF712_001546 [Marasmius tenuissimus]|uniref:Uncharacterized protein n=1 Tax=Marasmius tenuissimus TaxID=585030 RepID=A0ABR3AEC4_9AGAR